MALGDSYNNNQEKGKYKPTVYSDYRMSNTNSSIDSTRLSPTFYNKMLKIAIEPKVETNNEQVEWDSKNAVTAYLTHTKARLLYNQICEFQTNPTQCANRGVPTGSGLISISNGVEFGVSSPCLVIRRLNVEDGKVETSAAYEFKAQYHFAITNFDEKTGRYDQLYDDNIELEQFKSLLLSYFESMTGAVAYSIIDHQSYANDRMNGKIDSICEKLGVETNKGKYSNKSSSSYFNNNQNKGSSNFKNSTIDDIENEIG